MGKEKERKWTEGERKGEGREEGGRRKGRGQKKGKKEGGSKEGKKKVRAEDRNLDSYCGLAASCQINRWYTPWTLL